MSVVGVDTDAVAAGVRRFQGFPDGPAVLELVVSGEVRGAVATFATAWGRSDALIGSDVAEFAARLGRAGRLFAEAEEALTERGRREAA